MKNNISELSNIDPESLLPKPEERKSNEETLERISQVRDDFFDTLQNMGLSLEDATGIQHYLEGQFEGTTEDAMEKYLHALEDFRKRIKNEGFIELKKGDKIDVVKNDAVMITRGGSIVIIKRLYSGYDVHYIPISPLRKDGKVIKESFGNGYIKNTLTVGKRAKLGISNLPESTSSVIFAVTGDLQKPEAIEAMKNSIHQSFVGFRLPETIVDKIAHEREDPLLELSQIPPNQNIAIEGLSKKDFGKDNNVPKTKHYPED